MLVAKDFIKRTECADIYNEFFGFVQSLRVPLVLLYIFN